LFVSPRFAAAMDGNIATMGLQRLAFVRVAVVAGGAHLIINSANIGIVAVSIMICACVPAVLLCRSKEPTSRTLRGVMRSNSWMLLLMGLLPLLFMIGLGLVDYIFAQSPEALAPASVLPSRFACHPSAVRDSNTTRKFVDPARVRIWHASWKNADSGYNGRPDNLQWGWGVSSEERCGEWLHHHWGAPAEGGYHTACKRDFAKLNCSKTCHLAMQCRTPAPPAFPCGRWYIRGKAYDLNSFIERHPGGPRYLLDSVNTDVTALFESYHIGTTANRTLQAYLDESFSGVRFDEEAHQWPTNLRFKQLKRDIAKQFDLNDLKEPSAEYLFLLYTTLASHAALTLVSLTTEKAMVAWLAHAGLGFTTTFLTGMGHNGIHLYRRRPIDSMLFYLLYPTSPFRWMYWHVQHHHVHSNTRHDPDKKIFGQYQDWVEAHSPMAVVAPLIGTTGVAFQQATHYDLNHTSPSISLMEQRLGLLLLTALLALGFRMQGWRFALRLLLTISLANVLGFVGFQASHFQNDIVDGDVIRRSTDDWGEFQIRTTRSFAIYNRPATGMLFGFLNYHTAHHMFPAVHHSKLPLITPLIREHYPGLFQDYPVTSVFLGLYRVMVGGEAKLCRSNYDD